MMVAAFRIRSERKKVEEKKAVFLNRAKIDESFFGGVKKEVETDRQTTTTVERRQQTEKRPTKHLRSDTSVRLP